MTPFAFMLYMQETLPPPPEPTSSPDVNTAQVIGIVLLSLGLIVIAALAVRPLVARKRHVESPTAEPTPPGETPSPPEQGSPRAIIQFPTQVGRTLEPPHDSVESNRVIEERFGRVIGDSINRRKLGDRHPTRRAHDLALAALHRLDTEPRPRNGARGTAVAERSIFPIEDRRLSTGERVPPAQILQWHGTIAPAHELTRDEQGSAGSAAIDSQDAGMAVEDAVARRPAHDCANEILGPRHDERLNCDAVEDEEAASEFLVTECVEIESETGDSPESDEVYAFDAVGVDTQTLAGISQVLRDLIYCANSGQLFHGFALYSDPYLFRFMDATGLTEAEFREAYGSIGSRPRESWERLDRLSDVVRRPDGRIEATVSYVDAAGKPINGRERFRFALDPERRVWMIDDIAPVDEQL